MTVATDVYATGLVLVRAADGQARVPRRDGARDGARPADHPPACPVGDPARHSPRARPCSGARDRHAPGAAVFDSRLDASGARAVRDAPDAPPLSWPRRRPSRRPRPHRRCEARCGAGCRRPSRWCSSPPPSSPAASRWGGSAWAGRSGSGRGADAVRVAVDPPAERSHRLSQRRGPASARTTARTPAAFRWRSTASADTAWSTEHYASADLREPQGRRGALARLRLELGRPHAISITTLQPGLDFPALLESGRTGLAARSSEGGQASTFMARGGTTTVHLQPGRARGILDLDHGPCAERGRLSRRRSPRSPSRAPGDERPGAQNRPTPTWSRRRGAATRPRSQRSSADTSGACTPSAYRMLGREEDARDAAQDAFISCYRNLRNFRAATPPSPRGCTGSRSTPATTRCASGGSCWASRKRPSRPPRPTTATRRRRRSTSTGPCSCIPPDFRAVLVLHDLQDMAYEQIAEALDLPARNREVPPPSRPHRARGGPWPGTLRPGAAVEAGILMTDPRPPARPRRQPSRGGARRLHGWNGHCRTSAPRSLAAPPELRPVPPEVELARSALAALSTLPEPASPRGSTPRRSSRQAGNVTEIDRAPDQERQRSRRRPSPAAWSRAAVVAVGSLASIKLNGGDRGVHRVGWRC